MWDKALGNQFRSFNALARDFQYEREDTFPQVIYVEPSYGDSPINLLTSPNDNHPPQPIAFGEELLRVTYQAVTSNPDRWAKTVMIVTYDEHGGFFDHVPPRPIPAKDPDGKYAPLIQREYGILRSA
jgi:phospholipase C